MIDKDLNAIAARLVTVNDGGVITLRGPMHARSGDYPEVTLWPSTPTADQVEELREWLAKLLYTVGEEVVGAYNLRTQPTGRPGDKHRLPSHPEDVVGAAIVYALPRVEGEHCAE